MAGEDQPCGAAAHGPGGDADGQRGSGERGRLPGRGAADLAAGESEGCEGWRKQRGTTAAKKWLPLGQDPLGSPDGCQLGCLRAKAVTQPKLLMNCEAASAQRSLTKITTCP